MTTGAVAPVQDEAPDKTSAPAGTLMTVDQIMRRIHDQVMDAGGELPAFDHAAAPRRTFTLATWQPSAPRIAVKQEYVLDELLAFSDRDFIENAYRALLRRGPDDNGLSHHLTRLRDGQESKVGILAALRWSPEGEQAGVHVDGLLVPFLLQKWRRKRFIGPFIGWAHSLLRLGSIADRQVVLDAAQAREDHELGRVINLQARQLERLLAESEAARTRQASESSQLLEHLNEGLGNALSQLAELAGLESRLAGLESAHAHSLRVADQVGALSARLDSLVEWRAHSLAVAEQVDRLSAKQDEFEQVRAHSHAVAGQVGRLSARQDEFEQVRAHSHAVAEQVGQLSARQDKFEQVRAHSLEVASQVGALSVRMSEIADLRAHSNALAGHVGTLSTRLDELAGVRAHSHEVAGQVGTLSARLDELSVLAGEARTLAYRIDTLTARLDGQPDVVPVLRLLSERVEQLSAGDAGHQALHAAGKGVVRGK